METRLELNDNVWGRVVKSAEVRGFGSPQQYLTDLIEREVNKEDPTDAEIVHKMEDLGYIDYGRDI